MIMRNKSDDWLTTKEAAALAGKHENTIKAHRSRIQHKRLGYGSRSPLVFCRKSLIRWLRAYSLVRPNGDA